MKKIIFIGSFHEMFELAIQSQYEIVGFFDNYRKEDYWGVKWLGKDEEAREYFAINKFPVNIIPDDPNVRNKLYKFYEPIVDVFETIISESAKVSESAKIGKGTTIQSSVNISCECIIGDHVKLNTYCNVMHNSEIGDFTTIAPNAVILGNVKVGKQCYVGANATILPNLQIADNTIIGAGAIVTKNIDKPGTYIGNPARFLK